MRREQREIARGMLILKSRANYETCNKQWSMFQYDRRPKTRGHLRSFTTWRHPSCGWLLFFTSGGPSLAQWAMRSFMSKYRVAAMLGPRECNARADPPSLPLPLTLTDVPCVRWSDHCTPGQNRDGRGTKSSSRNPRLRLSQANLFFGILFCVFVFSTITATCLNG